MSTCRPSPRRAAATSGAPRWATSSARGRSGWCSWPPAACRTSPAPTAMPPPNSTTTASCWTRCGRGGGASWRASPGRSWTSAAISSSAPGSPCWGRWATRARTSTATSRPGTTAMRWWSGRSDGRGRALPVPARRRLPAEPLPQGAQVRPRLRRALRPGPARRCPRARARGGRGAAARSPGSRRAGGAGGAPLSRVHGRAPPQDAPRARQDGDVLVEDRLEGVLPSPAATLRRPAWSRSLRRVSRSAVVVVGAVCAVLIIGIALFANAVAPYPPDEQNFDLIESPPSAKALFGTDRFGRDVLSRVIHGSRISLYVAVTSISIAMLAGGALGLAAGYLGGFWDNAINRVLDVFFSVPGLLLSVGIAAMRGPGVNSAVVAIVIVYIPLFARVMRAPVLAEREKEYVEAIRALGATRWVVALKHVLPNVISPFVVQGTVALSQAILI